ncbi:MAG: Hpt domain-containing protein [Chlorobiales bacterium]|nr:Hpt domain-containing protein [Chlorobiales bacterium]
MKNRLHKEKNEPSDNSLQIFNYSDFLDRVMGDQELATSILEEFAGLIGQHAEKLRHAVESGDHESIRQIGHMIKGESGNISAPALYESSYAIEKAGKAQNSSEQNELLPVLLADIDNLTHAIREVLQKEGK